MIWSGFDFGIHKPVPIGNIDKRCARLVSGLTITVCRVRKYPWPALDGVRRLYGMNKFDVLKMSLDVGRAEHAHRPDIFKDD